MGTSTSFRSPPVPRWQAFAAALESDLPLERVRSELFNAGTDWEEAFKAAGVAEFAVAAARAREVLPARMAEGERPESVLQQYAAEARAESATEGSGPALALAERALTAFLARSASGDRPLSDQAADSAARALRDVLGRPGDAAVAYLGELLSQYARYATAREAGALTAREIGVARTRALVRELSMEAARAVEDAVAPGGDADAVRSQWADLVGTAFQRGRRLPPETS